jgi:RNA polymerase sigma-70 factor (ECF subfamily)
VVTAPHLVRLDAALSKPLSERNDDELMQLAQAGLREAFAVLVERYALRLVRTCAHYANDWTTGSELAQETWAALWQERARYRTGTNFALWLITAARNRCRNQLRHREVVKRHALGLAEVLGAPPGPEQLDELLCSERRRRVRDALARLPAAMSEALLLRYGEELRYDEMARILGARETTLRSRVHHGLKALRQLLENSP